MGGAGAQTGIRYFSSRKMSPGGSVSAAPVAIRVSITLMATMYHVATTKEANMGNNTQSRKWSLVINNPLEAGLDHTAIREILHRFSPAYFCLADEIATTGTYHTHIFLYSPSPMRFSTVKNRFPTAHIEKAYQSARINRDYIAPVLRRQSGS